MLLLQPPTPLRRSRGYGSERSAGRYLLRKADYAQILVARRVLAGLSGASSALLRALHGLAVPAARGSGSGSRNSSTNGSGSSSNSSSSSIGSDGSNVAEESGNGTAAAAISTRRMRSKQLQVLGQAKAAAASAASQPLPLRRVRTAAAPRPKPTDAFGRPYPDGAAGSDQDKDQQQQQQQWQPGLVGHSHSSKDKQAIAGHHTDAAQSGGIPRPAARLAARTRAWAKRVVAVLSDWGMWPRSNVVPLDQFDEAFPLLHEPSRLPPLHIEKASLPDLLDPLLDGRALPPPPPPRAQKTPLSSSDESQTSAAARWRLLPALLSRIEVVEPTFSQLLVVHRRVRRPAWWRRALPARGPVRLRVFREIPVASWQVVHPARVLQWRPLDLLRLDLFGIGGAVAALAQARTGSPLLGLLALASLSLWATRLVLGYVRMGDRYKSIVAQLLQERTVASEEGGVEYVAAAAGLQRWKLAAIAYVLLLRAERGGMLDEDSLAGAAEALLRTELAAVSVRFDTTAALSELRRFGLLLEARRLPQPQPQPGSFESDTQDSYAVVAPSAAHAVLQRYWAGLLTARVGSILRDEDM